MKNNRPYIQLFINLLLLLSFTTVIGLLVGYVATFLLISISAVFIWYNYNLIQLNHWLWHRRSLYPPQSRGIWRGIFDGIYKLQIKNRNRRKELGAYLKRFREAAEALPDAVILLQNQGQIAWCNKLASHMLGVRWPNDAGVRIDNLLRHPTFVEAFNVKKVHEPIILHSPVNPELVVEIRIVPYAYDEYLLLARDVTQVHRLNQMRKDFIANVSHELRTPLTVLQGYLEMYGDPDMHSAINERSVTTMTNQCERMMSLVNQLLVLSRIEANNDNVFDTVVRVPSLLKLIENEAQQLNKVKQHQIEFDVDANLMVNGFEDELRSAFTNLVKNAILHTQPGGVVKVTWCRTPEGAMFSVSDTGSGIASHHLSRLTERFYRVDTARSRETGGTGLGLSIVKHVLNHHNSKLQIDSEENVGSVFQFTLPEDLII